jgi:hypothetical protein
MLKPKSLCKAGLTLHMYFPKKQAEKLQKTFTHKGKSKHFLNRLISIFKNFAVPRIEPRALHMLDKCSTTELHPSLWVF